MAVEKCPLCGFGIYAKEWETLFHCPKCGKWWKKGKPMPCKGKKGKKGRRGGKK